MRRADRRLGAGALVGALLAATAGLRTLVIEKTTNSGYHSLLGRRPLDTLSAPTSGRRSRTRLIWSRGIWTPVGLERRQLETLPARAEVVDELERNRWIEFEWRPFSDYYCEAPAPTPWAASIYALNFDARPREVVEHLRQPLRPKGGWTEPSHMIGAGFPRRLLVALSETERCVAEHVAGVVDHRKTAGVGCVAAVAAGRSEIGRAGSSFWGRGFSSRDGSAQRIGR